MKEYQTPQREHSRSSDLNNRRSKESLFQKKAQKGAKKSLSSAFTSFSEDASAQISKELSDFSPISEISYGNCYGQLTESSVLALDPALSDSSEMFPPCDTTPASKVSGELTGASLGNAGTYNLDGSECSTVEAKVANCLKEAQTQGRSKKLVDELIKVAIDEYFTQPEKRDWSAELVSKKRRIVFLAFLLWCFLALSVIFFFGLGSQSTHPGPSPT